MNRVPVRVGNERTGCRKRQREAGRSIIRVVQEKVDKSYSSNVTRKDVAIERVKVFDYQRRQFFFFRKLLCRDGSASTEYSFSNSTYRAFSRGQSAC